MVTWDAAFEAQPEADVEDAISSAEFGAARIRELKEAIREREELEHNFRENSIPFHKAGKCSILYKGATASILALTGMSEGCIAFDTDENSLRVFHVTEASPNGEWVLLSPHHGALVGLDADDHTQYCKLTKTGQTLLEDLACTINIRIDGRDLSLDGAAIDLIPTVPADRGWAAWAGSYSADTVYGPYSKDCIISAIGASTTTGRISADGTTWRTIMYVYGNGPICFPVPMGHYWQVNGSPTSIEKMEIT